MDQGKIPDQPLGFIQDCIKRRRIRWTYHATLRLQQRVLAVETVLGSVDTFEVIEQYPADKYLPSYLVRAVDPNGRVFHLQAAVDVQDENIRIVTTYIPDPGEWDADLRIRRRKP